MMTEKMMVSSAQLHRTEFWEGKKNLAYQDPGGIWTIGMGHTGPEVHEGLFWTDTQIDIAAFNDMLKAETHVNSLCVGHLPFQLGQNEFDALCDFEFNTGALAKSTLYKKLLAGNVIGADAEFEKWVYQKGAVLQGLKTRREAEAELFLQPDLVTNATS